jgi:thiol-disulfide isomerase/thioredoxin
MKTYLPGQPELAKRLTGNEQILVICFCAAWCDTCRAYQPKFETLSQSFPQASFVWVDIEEEPALLGDADVENFPTLLIEVGGGIKFFGTMLPHIDLLERLIQSVRPEDKNQPTDLPDVRSMLIDMSR